MSKTTLTRTIGTLLGLSGQFPMLMKSCGRQGLLYHAVDMVWDMMERSVMGHGGEVYHGKSEYPSCKVRGRLTKDRVEQFWSKGFGMMIKMFRYGALGMDR
ncbi:hypothetical protein V6N13_034250 [Hibiscus sabdariffa]